MKDIKLSSLIEREALKVKLEELAKDINNFYLLESELVIVSLLKGSFVFTADLIRLLKIPNIRVEFLNVSSYGQNLSSSFNVKIDEAQLEITSKHVLIVEDIVDTGLTLAKVINFLNLKKPLSIKTCALLDKPSRREINLKVDYLGFTIPDIFVVGYGIDYNEMYRHLDYIAGIEI